MREQFCSYEIALKLKELGFDEDCFAHYCNGDLITKTAILKSSTMLYYRQDNINPYQQYAHKNCTAPLWQQAQSFLDDNEVIIGIIFVDNVFKYTLNIENYVSNGFEDRMSAIKSSTEHATNYLWNKKFNK